MKKTLLLVFVHGFKGSDNTFGAFPTDLCALLSHALPKLDVLSIQYPQYQTRGDLRECVARFKEWLQNKVIDLEVANKTPSPTVDPSVHVVLCGHSMGGIVAAETLLSVAGDEAVPSQNYANDTTNTTTGREEPTNSTTTSNNTSTTADNAPNLAPSTPEERSASAPPEQTRLFFPFITAVLAFDTPFLGISPGVLAHGAEEHFNNASKAYKAYDTASNFFGWKSPSGASTPVANSSRALPAAGNATGGGGWGKWAMYGGAAAAVAGAAGAAYLNRGQISEGLGWAGSHLEFVGCLARGAELQRRVERVTALERTHGTGFANFYGALGAKVTSKTKYAGAVLGEDRTFCVVPKSGGRDASSPTGSKREAPAAQAQPAAKRRRGSAEHVEEVEKGQERVQAFAKDTKRDKGKWVRCVNQMAGDELKAHTSLFNAQRNSDYFDMLPRARDQILEWVDVEGGWYEGSSEEAKTQNDEGKSEGTGSKEDDTTTSDSRGDETAAEAASPEMSMP